VDRIGHGTRAEEDDALVGYLAEHRIPVEMCPLSNVGTGVVPSIRAHPIRRFAELGVHVTVNTDDPKMFGNSLAEEYALLETELGFTRDEIRALILQGIEATWLSEERKRCLTESFCRDAAWLDSAS
jgi:adenosine deaminase